VQKQLLAKNPSTSLQVYAVWLPMLGGDARDTWNGNTMPDTRVTHYWDGNLQVGQWFSKNVNGYDGVAWDVYYLYGPDATWETVPTSLVGSGVTIYGERETLEKQVRTLLQQ
jgi:hypothetical protein